MPWVFDASIAAAWCLDDERTSETEALLDRLGKDGGTVPALFHLEIANVLTQAIRRKLPRCTVNKRDEFLRTLGYAPIMVDLMTHEHAWSSTLILADRHELSTYDAAYLELAIRLNVELATLDKSLRKAGDREGIRVIP